MKKSEVVILFVDDYGLKVEVYDFGLMFGGGDKF